MALATSAAVAAGATAAAMYLDAKYHFSKDVRGLRQVVMVQKNFAAALAKKRASLFYAFEDSVNRLPADDEAIWSRDGCYNWPAVYEAVCRYGQFYLSQGVRPGDCIAVNMPNTPHIMFSIIGLWSVGAFPAMINYNLSGEALFHCIKVAGAKLLLLDSDLEVAARVEELRPRIENELNMTIYAMDNAKLATFPSTRPDNSLRDGVTGRLPIALFYTSGSTGMPKAASYRTDRAWGLIGPMWTRAGCKFGPNGTRWYGCMPLYHGTGCNAALASLCNGWTLCIGRKFSATRFWDEIRESRSTAFTYVGELCRYLLAQPPSPRDREHNVEFILGNGIRPDVWIRFRDRFGIQTICEFFNSSEGMFGMINIARGDYLATAVGHLGVINRFLTRNLWVPAELDHETGDLARDPATGFAKRVPREVGGEILVAMDPTLRDGMEFTEYWNNPEGTAKKFISNVFQQGDLYYRTGDALRMSSDGRWYFMDRLGDTFRWKSENVSTTEVQECLGHFPHVVEALVYGVEIPNHDGRAGCASLYIPPEQRRNLDPVALLAHAKHNLPRYAVPVFIRLLTNLAPMHNQKPNKTPLKQQGIDPVNVGEDVMLWSPPGSNGYIPFREKDMQSLKDGTISV